MLIIVTCGVFIIMTRLVKLCSHYVYICMHASLMNVKSVQAVSGISMNARVDIYNVFLDMCFTCGALRGSLRREIEDLISRYYDYYL